MTGTIDKTYGQWHDSSNTHIRKVGKYTGPASYVTAGDPIAPADLGMARIELMLFTPATNGTLYLTPVWVTNTANGGGVVKWLVGTTGVEVANAVDISAYSGRFEAIGK